MKRFILIIALLLIIAAGAFAYSMTRTETRLVGFDSLDGDVIFSAELSADTSGSVTYAGGDTYLIAENEERKIVLTGYDLVSDEAWSLEISAEPNITYHPLHTDWKNVYVSLYRPGSNDTLIAIDRDTREINWQVERNWMANSQLSSNAIESTDEIVIYVDQFITRPGAQIVAHALRDGTRLWAQELNALTPTFVTTGDVLAISLDAVAVLTEIGVQTFNVQTGEPLWEQTLERQDGLIGVGDTLVIPQRRAVIGIDGASGAERWRITPPDEENVVLSLYDYTEPGYKYPMLYVQYGVGQTESKLSAYTYLDQQLQWEMPLNNLVYTFTPNYNGITIQHDFAPYLLTTYDRESGAIVWQQAFENAHSRPFGTNGSLFVVLENRRGDFWQMGGR